MFEREIKPFYLDREGNTMKKLSSKMKILLVLSICAAMLVPALASAEVIQNLPWADKTFGPGEVTLEYRVWKEYAKIEFNIVNGNEDGDYRVSSVMIALLDDQGKVKEVIIRPNQFNQDVGNAKATFSMEGLRNATFLLKIRGKKSNYIVLTVDEFPAPTVSTVPVWPRP